MDVAALPINQTPQPTTTSGPGELPADAAQPGPAKGADVFAKLLAKQVGLDTKDAAALEPVLDANTPVASDPTVSAADPALQLQQAALVMPMTVTVPNEIRVMPEADAHSDALVSSLPADNAAGVKDGVPRQSIAAGPAAFAAPGAASTQFPSESEARAGASMEKIFSLKSAQAELPQGATTSSATPTPVALPVQAPSQQQNNAVQPSSNIPQPVGHSAWGDMLGDRVVWMVSQQHQGVELHLNPPSLGPLDVRLSMSDGQASLSFATQHLPVKEAIESATARLREMLGESGISLGSVSVNLGSFAQQRQQPDGQAQSGSGRLPWVDAAPVAEFSSTRSATSLLSRNGMVDIFA